MINKKSAPSNWDDLVKDTRKIYEETDQDTIAKFKKCLPADLAYLFSGARPMPKLYTLTLSDRR